VIADIQVTDPVACEQYRPLAGASIAQFGRRFIVRGGKLDLIEGDPAPEWIVVIGVRGSRQRRSLAPLRGISESAENSSGRLARPGLLVEAA
jgi:uncharacterized protein (DUF1330 family)